MTLKVLHITPWFPGEHDPYEALFIREHINALNMYCVNSVICIKFQRSDTRFLSVEYRKHSEHLEFYIFHTKLSHAFLIEWMGFFLLVWLLVIKRKQRYFDMINMTIAYPLCVYLKFFRWLVKKPFVLTEHWSIYKYGFYLNKEKKGLKHIRNMFSPDMPMITVSNSLYNDIVDFSGKHNLKHRVIPNAVDTSIFHYKPEAKAPHSPVFTMINKWNNIKKPIIVIEAFEQFLFSFPDAQLIIGGYGPLWDEIKQTVQVKSLGKYTILKGKLNKKEIAVILRNSTALLQASEYETFSVICAESVCCGTPVIASNVGGIPSFINRSNGILIGNESVETWRHAMEYIFLHPCQFNREKMAEDACSKFSAHIVGELYYNTLKQHCKHYRNL